jgi:putative SOS response-associated peptidase YedK
MDHEDSCTTLPEHLSVIARTHLIEEVMHEQEYKVRSNLWGLMSQPGSEQAQWRPTDQVRAHETNRSHSYPSTNLLKVVRAGRRMLSLRGQHRH